jgi:aldehyde dehydrogenase (NAD+)
VNPCNGEVDAEIPLAGKIEVDEAAEAAQSAFERWRRTPGAERRRLLLRLADLIEENTQEFARLGTLDNGKPIALGTAPISTEWTRYYAGWADKLTSDVVASYESHGEFAYTLAQPYGVIGIIITWNGPLISLAMKVSPAVAAGNTVIVKPSELTPFSGELYADLVARAGFPDGVINILPGDMSAGEAVVDHPLVKKVTFTGGPKTARAILSACVDQMKPVVLELGGKAAMIVFEDADVESAGHGAVRGISVASGQGCTLPTRLLVQRSIYTEMVERVKSLAKAIVVGDPFAPETMSGPLVNQAALDRVISMVERAKSDGARLVTGGSRMGGELANGYFFEPTIFADVDPMSELAQTEVFGPVLAITPFDTEREAIAIANCTQYGLGGYVRTKNVARAHRVAEKMITGEVHINGFSPKVYRPQGGFGISGTGKEGGRWGIDEFLRVKSVSLSG